MRQLGIKEFTKAMSKAKSFVELGSRNDKFESSKPKETYNDGGNHKEEQDKNDIGGNGKNGGTEKPQNRKRKPNNYSRGKENEKSQYNALIL